MEKDFKIKMIIIVVALSLGVAWVLGATFGWFGESTEVAPNQEPAN